MKLLKTYSIVFAFICIWQCKDRESVIENPFPAPSATRLQELFDEGLNGETASAHFNASNTNFVYTSSRGTKVTINGTCLRLNGNPVTGTVVLEFAEIFDRSKMMASNKPTMGLKANGEEEMLLSGGEFYINVKQGTTSLTTTCPIAISTPTSNTGGTVTGMQGFNGNIVNNTLTWVPVTAWDVITNTQGTATYNLSVPGFGWFNCDKFYNYPEPKTTIVANVPAGYGNSSQVYLMTKSVPYALGRINGKFPVGLQCYLVMVSECNGNFIWEVKEQTLTANHTVTFDLKNAQTGKKNDLVNAINAIN